MHTGWLTKADQGLFYIINKLLSLQALDSTMLLLREPLTWVPVYLFFLLFFAGNCRKYIIPIVLLSVLTFSLTDFTSATLKNHFIFRLRPCHDDSLAFTVNSLVGCGGLFSMPSSHAANHFGLSAFWFLVISHTLRRRWYLLWVWAFAVCYAQVYVGVHYPADVAVGALVGVIVAFATFHFYKKWTASIDHAKITTGRHETV